MNELKQYIDFMFRENIEDEKVKELKEEILSNSLERVKELISEGTNEEDAIKIAILSLGDYKEMVDDLPKKAKDIDESGEVVYTYQPKKLNSEEVKDFAKHLTMGISINVIAGVILAAVIIFIEDKTKFLNINSFFNNKVIQASIWTYLWFLALGVYQIVYSSIYYYGFKETTLKDEKRRISKGLTKGICLSIIGLGTYLLFLGEKAFLLFGGISLVSLIIGISILVYTGITSQGVFVDEEQHYNHHKRVYHVTEETEYFGMISGAIYIIATVFFFWIGFTFNKGFSYSWLVYLVATAIHLIIEGTMKLRRLKK